MQCTKESHLLEERQKILNELQHLSELHREEVSLTASESFNKFNSGVCHISVTVVNISCESKGSYPALNYIVRILRIG